MIELFAAADETAELELKGVDIPPCPSILLEIDAELKRSDPDQRKISALIGRDVALSGHVMQIASSPAFCTGKAPASILQALGMLGNQQLFNLVVHQLLKVALSENSRLPMEQFWEASAVTARVAAEAARRLRCIRPDIAYTIGLFRDCGIPLLARRFDSTLEVQREAYASADESFVELENRRLGTSHVVVGYFLARRWRLPDEVCKAIRLHHDYAVFAEGDPHSPQLLGLVAVGAIAEYVAQRSLNAARTLEWQKAAGPVAAYLDMSGDTLEEFCDELLDWLE